MSNVSLTGTLTPPKYTTLHEVLAAEATVVAQANALMSETDAKFAKAESYFRGDTLELKMFTSDDANTALENQERKVRAPTTSVVDTLAYALKFWANAENIRATKNVTNTTARADIVIEASCPIPELAGMTVATDVPVDELMGLEARVDQLIKTFRSAPSLDASKNWRPSTKWAVRGLMEAEPETRVKQAKESYVLQLQAPTDKHPGQAVEKVRDINVGKVTTQTFSTALSSEQKANLLAAADAIKVAIRQARQRANSVPIIKSNVGDQVVAALLKALG